MIRASDQASKLARTSWRTQTEHTESTLRRASKQASKQAGRQACKQGRRQAVGVHSVGAMPWRGLFFYFIIYKIDKEYYEYKTTQNPRSMDLSHCSKKV